MGSGYRFWQSKVTMKVVGFLALCLVMAGCGQRSNGAVQCPSQGPNKVAEGDNGPYEYRDDCEPNALTCIDPVKLARTGNGVVICRTKGT
jgi:hypothetical protein